MDTDLTLRVDGTAHHLTIDTRTSLLDALRQRLGVTSPKKGCDHGQCGSCTVLVDGRRVLGCLSLAVAQDGAEVVTADGLGGGDHPVHRAFLDNDAFQCGYCTPSPHRCDRSGPVRGHARAALPATRTSRSPAHRRRCASGRGVRARTFARSGP